MSDSFTWTLTDAEGIPLTDTGLAPTAFPTQADAEAWLGQEWERLAEAGVAAVLLRNGDDDVYGPMSLSPAD